MPLELCKLAGSIVNGPYTILTLQPLSLSIYITQGIPSFFTCDLTNMCSLPTHGSFKRLVENSPSILWAGNDVIKLPDWRRGNYLVIPFPLHGPRETDLLPNCLAHGSLSREQAILGTNKPNLHLAHALLLPCYGVFHKEQRLLVKYTPEAE